jgi:histidinol-phosphate aminotransferase
MYPEYEKSTARIARHFGVRSDELALTNGGDEAIRVFLDTFVDATAVDSNSHILICEPTFPMYRYYAEIAGAGIVACRYDADLKFPLDAILAALRQNPRVFFLANPNNPTASLVHTSDLRKILRTATNTAVVFDEAYAEFSGLTTIPWIRRYRNLFITRTFSKAAGLAGLRLGAIIANREALAMVRRAMSPYPVNVAAMVAAGAALRDRKTVRGYVKTTLRTRESFAAALHQLGVVTFPSSANFLLANFGPAGPALFERLERKGILLRPRTHDLGAGFVRITVGTPREMKMLLEQIRTHWRVR